jgi:AcrR family transcriptional regulator
MHALLCFKEKFDPDFDWLKYQEVVEKLAAFFLVQGVKIGGVYRHFKGKEYLVTAVVRDAEQWSRFRVEYLEVTDANHQASRFVDEFLGMHESGVRRFTLVS